MSPLLLCKQRVDSMYTNFLYPAWFVRASVFKTVAAYKMMYKHAMELYNLYNSDEMSLDWVDLNMQQNFNGRVENVQIIDISRMRVGKNVLTNRLSVINNKIEYKWLNLSKDAFKIKCKDLFLK